MGLPRELPLGFASRLATRTSRNRERDLADLACGRPVPPRGSVLERIAPLPPRFRLSDTGRSISEAGRSGGATGAGGGWGTGPAAAGALGWCTAAPRGSWALVERFSNAFAFPLHRCRWLNDRQSLDVGGRRIMAVRPPVYDSPATRGFLDERSGIYWGVDAFAAPCPGEPVPTVADLTADFWAEGMAMFIHNALAPWVGLVDRRRYADEVDRVSAMGMTTIATAHSPLIPAAKVAEAFTLLRRLPDVPVPPAPDHSDLVTILAATANAAR